MSVKRSSFALLKYFLLIPILFELFFVLNFDLFQKSNGNFKTDLNVFFENILYFTIPNLHFILMMSLDYDFNELFLYNLGFQTSLNASNWKLLEENLIDFVPL